MLPWLGHVTRGRSVVTREAWNDRKHKYSWISSLSLEYRMAILAKVVLWSLTQHSTAKIISGRNKNHHQKKRKKVQDTKHFIVEDAWEENEVGWTRKADIRMVEIILAVGEAREATVCPTVSVNENLWQLWILNSAGF